MTNVVLIGFMGVGKSTVAKMVARRLQYSLLDTDAAVEAHAHCTIAQIFATRGEEAFRSLEAEVIAALPSAERTVISTGGGAPLNPANAENLRRAGLVFWLQASPECILRRVGNTASRPLLANAEDPLARVRELLAERSHIYRSVAAREIDTSGRSPRSVAAEIAWVMERHGCDPIEPRARAE